MGVERSFRLPELMNQCKLKMHKVGHRWFEITEHGCAIGYGILTTISGRINFSGWSSCIYFPVK